MKEIIKKAKIAAIGLCKTKNWKAFPDAELASSAFRKSGFVPEGPFAEMSKKPGGIGAELSEYYVLSSGSNPDIKVRMFKDETVSADYKKAV